jgi:hypothetical protein
MASLLRSAFSPSTYTAFIGSVIKAKRAEMNAGSFKPVVEAMVVTSFISYFVHYTCIDRYMIIEKQKIVKEALKDFEGHH